MNKEVIDILNEAGLDCYDIPNEYYILKPNPGEYIVNKLKEAGYEIVKKGEVIDVESSN